MFYLITITEGFLINLAIASVVCVLQHEVFVHSLSRELRAGSDLNRLLDSGVLGSCGYSSCHQLDGSLPLVNESGHLSLSAVRVKFCSQSLRLLVFAPLLWYYFRFSFDRFSTVS